MTLDQLLMFKTVAEVGSLRAASERLHKTQPAISQGIKQLEAQLDLVLFSRQAYRLALTDQGKMLLQHAQRVLNEAAEIKQIAQHLARGNEASITLAFEASFDLTRILPILEQTQNQFPNTQIILKQEYLTGAIEALSNKQADMVISPVDAIRSQTAHLEMAHLHRGQLIDVASPRLLARHPELRFGNQLLKEYQIVVQDTGTGSGSVEFGVQEGQRRWYVNDFHTKKMLILSGMGWGKLPDYMIVDELERGQLQAFVLQDKRNRVDLDYYVLKNKAQRLGPVASALWEGLGAYLGQQ